MTTPQRAPATLSAATFIGHILIVSLTVLLNFLFLSGTAQLDASDFRLIAWHPGQALLSGAGVDLNYPYPLWTVVVMLPWVLSSAQLGEWLWLIFNVLLIAITTLALTEVFGWRRRPAILIVVALLISWCLPVVTGLWLGQLIFSSLATLALLALTLLQRRQASSGALAGLIMIKPQVLALVSGALLLWALLTRSRRLLGGFAVVALGLVLISAPFALVPRQIVGGGVSEHLDEYMSKSSSLWGLSLTLAPGLWQIPLALSLALLLWLTWLWLPTLRGELGEQQLLYVLSATTIVNLLIIPYSWMHNFALLIFPLCFALSQVWRMRGPARLAWVSLLLFTTHILPPLIFVRLSIPHESQVHQVIPASLLLLQLVVLQRRGAGSTARTFASRATPPHRGPHA